MKKIIAVLLIILTYILIFCANNTNVNAYSNDIFTGQSGSPNGNTLYNETNTFQYNGNNLSASRNYVYYDTSVTNNNLIKS